MPESVATKYLIKMKFEVDGTVEKPDVIGALFGQTEGLLGPELNLSELQRSYRVGRIEIELEKKGGKTIGEVIIPMSTDIATAALIAATIETVEKVGPFASRFSLFSIEDVRAVKRKQIIERAKNIVKEWAIQASSDVEDLLKEVSESMRRAKPIAIGREEISAGPGIFTSDTIFLVEGRADVIALLRAGIDNVIAIEGSRLQETVNKLPPGKKLVAFLDGDRAGDLILKELQQAVHLSGVVRAPEGKEVEELTPKEIRELLSDYLGEKQKEAAEEAAAKPAEAPLPVDKLKQLHGELEGTLEAVLLDEGLNVIARCSVSELIQRLQSTQGVKHVVFDGVITQRLVDLAAAQGIATLIGQRVGELDKKSAAVHIATFKELGIQP
jgi:DNA primase